jgi:hypothetical protein
MLDLTGFMFDTNIFNHLLDGRISPETFPDVEIYYTYEQYDELLKTSGIQRREELLSIFQHCDPLETTISTFVIGNARLGNTELGEGTLYEKILEKLDSKKKKKNNYIDALIAESSYLKGLTLVTCDGALLETCLELDIPTMTFNQFLNLVY